MKRLGDTVDCLSGETGHIVHKHDGQFVQKTPSRNPILKLVCCHWFHPRHDGLLPLHPSESEVIP